MIDVFCLLANISLGLPLVKFEELHFQLFPVNRVLCPHISPNSDVVFELYTRNNRESPDILRIGNTTSIDKSNINLGNPTVIFFHGFLETSKSDDAVQIKTEFLKLGEYNVILPDASRLLAGPDYLAAAANVEPIGKYTAELIDYLVTKGLSLSSLHVIGMSLGGQIAGFTGQNVKSGKLQWITGLDPAGPLFTGLPENRRLDPSDAKFVDVVHSSAGIFGYNGDCGHIDFWLNDGTYQPGCSVPAVLLKNPSLSKLVFCNHWRAYQIYAKSINNPRYFQARSCDNWRSDNWVNCSTNNVAILGPSVNKSYVYVLTQTS